MNGLAIQGGKDDIAEYYKRELIRGPGAVVEVAQSFEDFERVMQRKLIRETQAQIFSSLDR